MRAHVLPIAYAVVLLMAMFISYSIAVTLEHVPAVLPYISDTGVLAPERSVFSQLINVSVVLQLVIFYIRFEQVNMVLESFRSKQTGHQTSRVLYNLNRVCLWLGLSICFGMSLIGNFQLESSFKKDISVLQDSTAINQEETSVVIDTDDKAASIVQNIHWTGAFLAFVGGLIWMTIQSWFSVKFCSCPTLERHVEVQNQEHQHLQIRRTEEAMDHSFSQYSDNEDYDHGCKARGMLRLALSLIGLALLFTGIGLAIIAGIKDEQMPGHNKNSGGTVGDRGVQEEEHSLETWHGRISVSAAFCEWIISLLVVVYMLSFVPEFRGIELTGVVKKQHQRKM